MQRDNTSAKSLYLRLIPAFLLVCLGSLALISPIAFAREPDSKNDLPIRKNPTATVTGVCYRLDEKDYSQLVHATCYSEFKQAVVVLVSGNAESATGLQISQYITGEFGKSYVPATAFLENPNRRKVTISYLLNGDAYGPYSGKNWREGLSILIQHSAQAWHEPNN